MLPCTQKIADLPWKPKGVILSGSPFSVYEEIAPHVDPEVFKLDVPILGICYGLQELAWHHGKNVLASKKKEYGHAYLNVQSHGGKDIDRLFQGLEDRIEVWMSHGDSLSALPPDFEVVAATNNAPFAGIAHTKKPYWGIQFHPEVSLPAAISRPCWVL
jgi:GMP synthase (glutamine-hydrolysing)